MSLRLFFLFIVSASIQYAHSIFQIDHLQLTLKYFCQFNSLATTSRMSKNPSLALLFQEVRSHLSQN